MDTKDPRVQQVTRVLLGIRDHRERPDPQVRKDLRAIKGRLDLLGRKDLRAQQDPREPKVHKVLRVRRV